MRALQVVVVVLGLMGLSCSRSPRPAPPPAEPPKPVAVVNADDLVAEYQKNALAADAKYKSQLIDVKGKVARVGRGLVGDPYVQLGGSALEDAFGVTCYLAKSAEAAAAQLKEGESVTMRGVCQGLYAGQALRLFDCEIVK
jgi:hypothetical protein